jgi:hypothetical protein
MLDLILRPLADAFMEVGVFVALLVAPFGWARYRWGHTLDDALERHRALGPLVAALMTVPPGCGGAIIVMSLYARGAVSYGAAIAALVATMGDASWLLLAADPWLTLQLKVLLVVVGTATGHLVDALGIAPTLRIDREQGVCERVTPVAPPPRRPTPVLVHELGMLPALLWVFLGSGMVVSLPVTFQVVDEATMTPYVGLGVAGTLLCVFAFVRGGCKAADDDVSTAHPTSMGQVLRHGGYEVAFVTVWVAAAYVGWSLLSHSTGFDGSQLPLFGVAGVVVGALVGLIPGCAIQIVFAGIFLSGGMPLPTLVANTISQDGDALIPLLALEHRSALLATVLTTLPALLVGGCLLLLT